MSTDTVSLIDVAEFPRFLKQVDKAATAIGSSNRQAQTPSCRRSGTPHRQPPTLLRHAALATLATQVFLRDPPALPVRSTAGRPTRGRPTERSRSSSPMVSTSDSRSAAAASPQTARAPWPPACRVVGARVGRTRQPQVRYYYVNTATGETTCTWTRPEHTAPAGGSSGVVSSPQPVRSAASAWKENYSEEHARPFWTNTMTGA